LHQKRKLRSSKRSSSKEKAGAQEPRKRFRGGSNQKEEKKPPAVIARRAASSSSSRQAYLAKIRMRIDDEPLTAQGDEDDELLLTSKGWDWDPSASCVPWYFLSRRLTVKNFYLQESSAMSTIIMQVFGAKGSNKIICTF
jgi:hypothetical protein